jgi:hypothetical protein
MSMHQNTDARRWKITGETFIEKALKRAIQNVERLWLSWWSINALFCRRAKPLVILLELRDLERSNSHGEAGDE